LAEPGGVGRIRLEHDPSKALRDAVPALEPVQRALAGDRRPTLMPYLQSTQHHTHDRIMPLLVVIGEVLGAIEGREALEGAMPSTRWPKNVGTS
jgi:hypothetical protein